MVDMLQAGLFGKGLLPNDMQGVLLEEGLPSNKLRAVFSCYWCVLPGLAKKRFILTCALCFR